MNEPSVRTLREPAMALGTSFWDVGLEDDSLAVADNEVSHSRSRFIVGGLGCGNGSSPSQASEYRTSLMRNRLVRTEISV